jgi:hypothetical protein
LKGTSNHVESFETSVEIFEKAKSGYRLYPPARKYVLSACSGHLSIQRPDLPDARSNHDCFGWDANAFALLPIEHILS